MMKMEVFMVKPSAGMKDRQYVSWNKGYYLLYRASFD